MLDKTLTKADFQVSQVLPVVTQSVDVLLLVGTNNVKVSMGHMGNADLAGPCDPSCPGTPPPAADVSLLTPPDILMMAEPKGVTGTIVLTKMAWPMVAPNSLEPLSLVAHYQLVIPPPAPKAELDIMEIICSLRNTIMVAIAPIQTSIAEISSRL